MKKLFNKIKTKAKQVLISVLAIFGVFIGYQQFNVGTAVMEDAGRDNLIAYWSFEEGVGTNATDFSGNDNVGTLANMDDSDWVKGRVGKALDFDGTNDYVNTVTNPFSNAEVANSGSLATWVKFDSLSNNPTIVADLEGWVQIGYGLLNIDSTLELKCRVYDGSEKVVNTFLPDLDTWYHVVTTWDGTNMRCYVDGVLEGTVAAGTIDPDLTSVTFVVGAQSNGLNTGHLDGLADEVRVYSSTLSATEVSDLYNQTKLSRSNQPDNTDLIGYWSFEDGVGDMATDFSVYNNAGTLTNMADSDWVVGRVGKALDFDGTNEYVQIGTTNAPEELQVTTNFTVAAWVKTDTTSGNPRVIGRDDVTNRNWWIDYLGSNKHARFNVTSSGSNNVAEGTSIIDDGEWHHLVGVHDGTNIYIYVDGVQEGSDTSGAADNDTEPVLIGVRGDLANDYTGLIDDVRMYNNDFSSTQVLELYNQTKISHINNSQNQKMKDGLAGMWSFNGADLTTSTSSDVSGNSNDGTLTNGPVPIIGVVGQALDFDGVDDYVTIPDDPAIDLVEMTIAGWVKADSWDSVNDLFGKPYSSGSYVQYGIAAQSVGTLFWLQSEDNVAWQTLVSTTLPSAGEWFHVAGTNDGSTARLYIDGVEVGTPDASPATSTGASTEDFSIGMARSFVQDFDGKIDEIRMYNRALSADEVRNLYNLGM